MMFSGPDKARKEGFDCNKFSGKFNFYQLKNKEQIDNVFKMLN